MRLTAMPTLDLFGWAVPVLVVDLSTVAIAVVAALALHWLVFRIAGRIAARTPDSGDDILVAHARRPSRWILVAIALAAVRGVIHLPDGAHRLWTLLAGLIVPALIGWLAIALIRGVNDVIAVHADISIEDNLNARRKRTRSAILGRIAVFVIGFVTVCVMLLSIPSVRNVGVTLMASAGLAGLAVGAAAQPALKNLIAGIQMAFTEPIRIDDVVIIEGEWGRIEEIRLTYVIVRIWDDRRLVVPVSKFLEDSFQNWTRTSSALMGTVFLHLDPRADVARIRAKAEELVAAHPKWDRRVIGTQVTEQRRDAIEVRVLVSAADAGRAFDLRCDMREGLMRYIADEMPEALPRERLAVEPITA
ncbi:mechanosensitive ion channel family protein [Sphingomonas sp. CCH15-F11]|uniref:mechanosensitive ion channel family protein n=2 Tax=unclassified Sphingomonas TaxID=196159 RepID=UPI0009E904D2|nr:mechanosensitive ion channel family protein [Sphingomonas sp. CCH15-F11]